MDTAATIVANLNEMLDADHFDKSLFELTLKSFKDLCNPSIKFLDFKHYNEKLLKKLKKEKFRLVKIQDFENAAKLRDEEKECAGYITIRTVNKIEKSAFHFDQGYLYFLYMGNARNDRRIKKILEFN
jgi:hypothetical protein